jgi:hypothetical protein
LFDILEVINPHYLAGSVHRSIAIYFLILSFFIGLPLWSQTPVVTPSTSANAISFKPIDVRFSTLGGLSYTQGDDVLKNYQDLQDVLGSLKDFETERLLNRSESAYFNSKIFELVGLVGAITGVTGLLTTSGNQQTPFWFTAAGGGVLFDIGTLFGSEAETAKFNAVQRYNRFAYGREQILPQAPTDEKSLLPITTPSLAVTPDTKGLVNGSK